MIHKRIDNYTYRVNATCYVTIVFINKKLHHIEVPLGLDKVHMQFMADRIKEIEKDFENE